MKKIGFYVATLVAGVLASCSNVEDIQTSQNEMEDFVAVVAEGGTRTVLDATDGKGVLWSNNDALAIFRKTGKGYNTKYVLKSGEGTSNATFSYAGVYSPTTSTPNLVLENNYAVYPYAENITMTNEGIVNVTIPAEQTYAENTFDSNASFMFAAKDGNDLEFMNAHALLKVALTKMPGDDDYSIQSIKLSSETKALSGAATIKMENGVPEVALSGTNKDLTLNCTNGVAVSSLDAASAAVFYLVVTPGTYSDLKLTLTGTNYTKELELPQNLIIARNKIITIQYTCGSDDFTGTIPGIDSTEEDVNP